MRSFFCQSRCEFSTLVDAAKRKDRDASAIFTAQVRRCCEELSVELSMLAILATVSVLALAPGTRTLQFVPAARPRAARPTAMRIFDDAEKWIGDNLGAIVKKKPMGGGSGWASLSRYEVAGMDADIVVKASGSKPLESMFSRRGPRSQGPGRVEDPEDPGGLPHGGRLRGRLLLCDGLPGVQRAGGPDALRPQDGGDAPGRAAGRRGQGRPLRLRRRQHVRRHAAAQLVDRGLGHGRVGRVLPRAAHRVPDPPRAQHAADQAVGAHARGGRPTGWRTSSRGST